MLVTSAACGAPNGAGSPAPVSTTAAAEVGSVQVLQTGGFAGVHDLYTVDKDNRATEKAELYGKVTGADFRSLKDEYRTPNNCRDQFGYEITVKYADGQSKKVTTEDCSQKPQLVTDVIGLARKIGVKTDGR
ncbi:hypothetical protein D5S17_28500 [Pseudonocardiaceae bacterium YIM PH 21723]|nr:hypothetical protein D5S17_28500 [Pseudonocardiaceae bacterium YIM PH 21723]